MAGTGGRPSTERGRTTDDARDELHRVLERDTAVQGERAEESPAANRHRPEPK